jgi:NAD(P)H-hydrate epimerase
MQLLATAEQMQGFDHHAIRRLGIPGVVLMENAGRAFVDFLEQKSGPVVGKLIVVMCGKGNNGGDGFVIARHLANRGASVKVYLLGTTKEVKGDAKVNLSIILKLATGRRAPIQFEQLLSPRKLRNAGKPDIVVDAIFGTGFTGPLKGIAAAVAEWINTCGAMIASVDIPSGVNASSGAVETTAVHADLTVTMGLAKVGHFVGEGRYHSGDVVVGDIGMPRAILVPTKNQVYRVGSDDVKCLLPQRPHTAHKYTVGKVFVLAGSRGFTGAPFLCAQAAMKSGVGAVLLGIPKGIHFIMAKKATEVILLPLDETSEGTVGSNALPAIEERIAWADVVVVGPGLSRNRETQELLARIVPRIAKPLVLDADALYTIARDSSLVKRRKHETVLTPHVGELGRIIKKESAEIEERRVEVARSSAEVLRSVVALKGSPTATASASGEVYLNSSGNPGMATAGSGDALAGVIASLAAQGITTVGATYSGVFVHGLAGDLAEQRFGQRGMMAVDIVDALPLALRSIEG